MKQQLTFAEFKAEQARLEKWCDDIGSELRQYPRGPMGLVLEEVRVTDAYQQKQTLFRRAFNQLRTLNGKYVKLYAKELHEERKLKYAAGY